MGSDLTLTLLFGPDLRDKLQERFVDAPRNRKVPRRKLGFLLISFEDHIP